MLELGQSVETYRHIVRPTQCRFLFGRSVQVYIACVRPTEKILYNTALSSLFSVLALGHIREYAPFVLDLDALRLPHSTTIFHLLSSGIRG